MNPLHSLVALAAVATCAAGVLAAQTDTAARRDLNVAADTIFARWNSTHTPGCAVGVAQHGRTILMRGYGMANLETRTPLTSETILESGSVAKQFTAAAVVLLAMDGKLDLDDDVRKYIPELPRYDRPITIRHLLTHTSGLREWSSLVAAAGWPRGERAHTQADLLDVAYRQQALNYPVGEHYSYTNTGYAIAMSLVERVSGKSFQQFSRERIFEPLGMRHTQWRDDFTRVVPGRAQAYSWESTGGAGPATGEWRLAMPFENVVGPGGMLTTVADWLIWNEALAKSTLRPGLTDSLTRRMRLNNGREITYALGLVVSTYRGVREIGHSGSTGGYSTYLTRFPDRGNLSIAVLCNSTEAEAVAYARRLADRIITDFPTPAPVDTARVDVASLARHFGLYRNTRTHSIIEVNQAAAARMRALPNGWYWLPNNARWEFVSSSNGGKRTLRVAQPDGDTLTYVFVGEKAWVPSARELQAFVGTYSSDEVGVPYRVELSARGDSLTLINRAGSRRTLRPTARDAFALGGTAVWFTRDRSDRVTAMHLSQGRMWNLMLRRQ